MRILPRLYDTDYGLLFAKLSAHMSVSVPPWISFPLPAVTTAGQGKETGFIVLSLGRQ